jgi:hypothetical protein
MPGARRFVQVLQLLAEHPLTRVRRAVEECARADLINAEAVIERTRTLAAIEALTNNPVFPEEGSTVTPAVQVPLPDLSRFDELLLGRAGPDDCIGKTMTTMSCDVSVPGSVSVLCT